MNLLKNKTHNGYDHCGVKLIKKYFVFGFIRPGKNLNRDIPF